MKKRFLLIVVLILTGALGYQSYTLMAIPDDVQELIRNELSYYHMVNLDERMRFADSFQRRLDHRSSSPRFVACNKEMENNERLFRQSISRTRRSFLVRNSKEVANEMLNEAVKTQKQMLDAFAITSKEIVPLDKIEIELIDNDDLAAISLNRNESRLNHNFLVAMDYYRENCQGIYCGFTTFEGLIMKQLGSPGVHDSLDATIPNPLKARLKERIQVVFSKKFISQLTDSLKYAGSIGATTTNAYTAFVRLSSDDMTLLPFDNEKQAVSESYYTVWEYDLLSEEPGIKNLTFQVGIVLRDSANRESVKYVNIPVAPITVIE
jgi:hypothetical protein